MTGGIRHDGGIEVTEVQKHGLYVHDLDDPSAGERGWSLCARRLANGLVVCGSKRARGRLPREPLPLQQRAVQEAEEKMPSPGTPARWRASLGSGVCALWTDPQERRLASPPPWCRLFRTCPHG